MYSYFLCLWCNPKSDWKESYNLNIGGSLTTDDLKNPPQFKVCVLCPILGVRKSNGNEYSEDSEFANCNNGVNDYHRTVSSSFSFGLSLFENKSLEYHHHSFYYHFMKLKAVPKLMLRYILLLLFEDNENNYEFFQFLSMSISSFVNDMYSLCHLIDLFTCLTTIPAVFCIFLMVWSFTLIYKEKEVFNEDNKYNIDYETTSLFSEHFWQSYYSNPTTDNKNNMDYETLFISRKPKEEEDTKVKNYNYLSPYRTIHNTSSRRVIRKYSGKREFNKRSNSIYEIITSTIS